MPILMLYPGIDGIVIRQQKKWIKLSTFGMVVKRYFADNPTEVQSEDSFYVNSNDDQLEMSRRFDSGAPVPTGTEIRISREHDTASSQLFHDMLSKAEKRVIIDFVPEGKPIITKAKKQHGTAPGIHKPRLVDLRQTRFEYPNMDEALAFVRITLEGARIENQVMIPPANTTTVYDYMPYPSRVEPSGTYWEPIPKVISVGPATDSLTLSYLKLIPDTGTGASPRSDAEVTLKAQLELHKR